MSEIKHTLPAWMNGLIIFLFTPALVFLIASALIALAIVVVVIVIANLPMAIWCAITSRPFELKFWEPLDSKKKGD